MPNKTVTQVPVGKQDVKRIVITLVSEVGGVGTYRVDFEYTVRDSAGTKLFDDVYADLLLAAGDQTTINTFVANKCLPAANTKQGT